MSEATTGDLLKVLREMASVLERLDNRLAQIDAWRLPDPWGEPDHHTSALVDRASAPLPMGERVVPRVGSGVGAPPPPKP